MYLNLSHIRKSTFRYSVLGHPGSSQWDLRLNLNVGSFNLLLPVKIDYTEDHSF